MQIWKFSIPFSPPSGLAQMPQGAKVLSAGVQDNDIVIWALVDPTHEVVKRLLARLEFDQHIHITVRPLLPRTNDPNSPSHFTPSARS